MTIDEAIQHCKEQVQEQAKRGCYSCAEEHQQLAEWLKELKAYRSRSEIPNTCGDAISRQAVLDVTWEEPSYTDALNVLTEVRDKVKVLPSVTPQQKTLSCSEKPNKWMSEARRWKRRYLDLKYRYLVLEQQARWIPVSERLPEERKKCLVAFRGGYVGIMCYASDLYRVDEYDFCDEKGKAGWFDYDRELGHYSRDDVIAWLPLPLPYKAESEEKE